MLARRQAFAARHSWARRAADINEAIGGQLVHEGCVFSPFLLFLHQLTPVPCGAVRPRDGKQVLHALFITGDLSAYDLSYVRDGVKLFDRAAGKSPPPGSANRHGVRPTNRQWSGVPARRS